MAATQITSFSQRSRLRPRVYTNLRFHEETRKLNLEHTLREVKEGRRKIPADADIATFLLSNGELVRPLEPPPEPETSILLKQLFEEYFASLPEDSREQTTLEVSGALHAAAMDARTIYVGAAATPSGAEHRNPLVFGDCPTCFRRRPPRRLSLSSFPIRSECCYA